MKFVLSILLSLFLCSAIVMVQANTIDINCGTSIGNIKYDLAGVSMGGNAHSYNNPEVRSAVSGTVKFVRLEGVGGPNYEIYNPVKQTYEFERLFAEIDKIQSTGAIIIADIFYMPQWLSSKPNEPDWWLYAPSDYDKWKEYITQIVYNVNIANEGKRRIDYWEIWNEPTGNMFKGGTNYLTGGDYFYPFENFYSKTSKAIKLGDPTAKVGGYADNPFYNNYKSWATFQKNNNSLPDFISLHHYGEWLTANQDDPKKYLEYAVMIVNNVKAITGQTLPVIYSEWNLNADGNAFPLDVVASYMAQSLYWMQTGNGTQAPVEKACFFRIEKYQDTNSSLLDDNYKFMAPSRVLQMFKMLQPNQISSSVQTEKVVALATTNNNKDRITTMISRHDTTEGDSTQDITISNHNLNGTYTLKIYAENSATVLSTGSVSPIATVTGFAEVGVPIIISTQLLKSHSVLLLDLYSSTENLIRDGGLEGESGEGWDNGTVVNSNSHSGNYALEIEPYYWSFNTIKGLTPNTEYEFTAWGKNAIDSEGVYFGVKSYNGASEKNVRVNGTTYQKMTINFMTGATDTAVTIYMGKNSGSNVSYGDDFMVRKVQSGEYFFANAGFEDATITGWSSGNITSDAYSGSKALKMNAGWDGCDYLLNDLSPNTEYVLSMWGKAEVAGQVFAKVRGYDKGESNLPNSAWNMITIDSTSYKKYYIHFTTGEDNFWAIIGLWSNGYQGYFDDFKLEKVDCNYLVNGTFESGLTGWNGGAISTDAYSGSKALEVAGYYYQCNYAVSGLAPNTDYMLSMQGKLSADCTQAFVGIKDFGGDTMVTATSKSYQQYIIRFRTGADNTSATIGIWRNDGTAYFDDLKLVMIKDDFNYVANPTFEGGLTGWNGGAISTDSYSGSKALEVTTWYYQCNYPVSGLEPNTDYILSIQGKVSDATPQAFVGIKDFGGDTFVTVTSKSYQQYLIRFRTGSTNTSATIGIWRDVGAAYFDNLEIKKVQNELQPSYIKFYKGSLEITETGLQEGSITVRATVPVVAQNAIFLVALYDGVKIVDLKIDEAISTQGSKLFDTTIPVSVAQGKTLNDYTLKVFLWDGYQMLSPKFKAKEFK